MNTHCRMALLFCALGCLLTVQAQTVPQETGLPQGTYGTHSKIFRTKPYLQRPEKGGLTVVWETTVPTYSWVEYGTDTLHVQRARTLVDGQVLCNVELHRVRLEPLQPGVRYYYRICSQEMLRYEAYSKKFGETAIGPWTSFTLPATDEDSFTALVFNDLHKNSETYQALCRQIQDMDYDFVIFNGDCINDPASHEQVTHYLRELMEGVQGDTHPVFFLRGNHEIRNAYSVGLRNHLDYIGGKTYGAFSWGDTRFVILDCGEDKPDNHKEYSGLNDFTQLRLDQVDFLKEELHGRDFRKASKRVLVHHIPLDGKSPVENLCDSLWMPLLSKGDFDLCVNAHQHRFKFHPKRKKGQPYPVVVGGGPSMDKATVMVLHKEGKELSLKVLNPQGEVLLDNEF